MAARLSPHRPGIARPWRRRLAGLALAGLVALLHGWVVDQLEENRISWGSGDAPPVRLEVSFVKELVQKEPAPAPAERPKPAPQPRPAKPAAAVAPLPAMAASVPEPAMETPATEVPPVRSEEVLDNPPTRLAAEAGSAPAGPPFEWPPSTELVYELTGYYRGPISGTAHVRWIRDGMHYQVHLDVFVGLEVAPLMSRRMTSDGELTDQGLHPWRYDEYTRIGFGEVRHVVMRFEPEQVVLANGSTQPRWAGVQDTASQFVQLTWMFTQRPDLLQTGRSVELPLALPRRMDYWIYDVMEQDQLDTPFGRVPALHVKPRRLVRPTNELSVEAWFAPSLQYLPARMRINQSADSYVDLMLKRRPLQAAPAAVPKPGAAASGAAPYSPPRPTIGDMQ